MSGQLLVFLHMDTFIWLGNGFYPRHGLPTGRRLISQVDAFITSDLNCDTRRRHGGFVFKCDDPTDAAAVA